MSWKVTSMVFVVALLMAGCQKKVDEKDIIAKVGKVTIDKDNFEAFRKTARIFPTQIGDLFPGMRPLITFMVETEALYTKARRSVSKGKIEQSRDWQWKSRYFPAQLYVMEVLSDNLGVTEKEIEDYYKAHPDSFKTTVKKDSVTDSTYRRPIAEVKPQIVEDIFYTKFKPDSAFLSTLGDSLPDSSVIKRRWIYSVRTNLQEFFMKRFYEDQYGKKYPDSISEVYGEGKPITPEDMEVILSWVPEARREQYRNPQGTKELAEWLIKWKLFADRARETGFATTPAMKDVMDWAWKIEVVRVHINTKIEPAARKAAVIDSSMILYSYYDEYGSIPMQPDTSGLRRHSDELYKQEVGTRLDSIIWEARRSLGVQFMQSDWKDEKNENPAVLLARADSLRDTGSTDAAENLYRTLSTDFVFTGEGKKALVEYAKIQTEKQMYQQAIKNYRRYLVTGTDSGRSCNTFFMIGFIYDEYMDRPEMAEVNYKWLLKNTPDCELADDAEFMMLHLNEPMTSVEELQAEARRQGRKIDESEEDTLEMNIDTLPPETAKTAS
jgi:outer membrane protein assembly factor BamD (BamD/ComL family)